VNSDDLTWQDGGVRNTGPQVTSKYWQRALNAHWPPAAIARRLQDRPDPRDVWVAIEWERDGWQWLPGKATRWDRDHVMVRVDDVRLQVGGVWVAPIDVRRQRESAHPVIEARRTGQEDPAPQ
jgi:hypothetical protein